MMIKAYFSEGGAAKTGLSPTIDITDVLDGSLDVNDGAMTELANGWYKYDFSAAVAGKDYVYLCDGGAGLPNPERYIPGMISQPAGIQKGVALSNFEFLMVLSSDHVSPATGKTLTEEISKDGGAFAACSNDASEVGNGVYKIDLTALEMDADIITLKFTEGTCDQRTITIKTSIW